MRIPIRPVPVAVAPDAPVPETGATGHELVPGEVRRILDHQDRGWVATTGELRDYLAWLWALSRVVVGAGDAQPQASLSSGMG